ncbi:hypothetical protein ACFX2H_015498 [Malus domestica]
MASPPTKVEMLGLFRSPLRTARQFSDYNVREYTSAAPPTPSATTSPFPSRLTSLQPFATPRASWTSLKGKNSCPSSTPRR